MVLSKGQKRKIKELLKSEFHRLEDICTIVDIPTIHILKGYMEKYGLKKEATYIPWLTKSIKKDILSWDYSISISKYAKKNNISVEGLRKYLKKLNINTSFGKRYAGIQYEITEDIIEMFKNPRLSAYDISIRTNRTRAWIKENRRKYVSDFSLKKDYRFDFSSFEHKLSLILNDLDIVFFHHYQILDYNIDFYLGKKLIIEVEFSKFHNKDKDDEKIKHLKSEGYSYYSFNENDLEDIPLLSKTITNIWDRHIRNSMK